MHEYDIMKRVMMLAGIGGILLFGMYWRFYRPDRMEDYIQAAEQGRGSSFDEKAAGETIHSFTKVTEGAMALLKEGRYKDAADLYKEKRSEAEHLAYSHPSKPAGEIQTIREWYDGQQDAFNTAWRNAMQEVLREYGRGVISGYELDRILSAYTPPGESVRQIIRNHRDELDQQRARRAVSWVRVTFDSHRLKDYYPQFEKAFRDRWDDRFGYQLVFGEPVGQKERHATWRHLHVDVAIKTASYHVSGDDTKAFYGADIPETCTITYKAEGETTIPSTWDKPDVVFIRLDVPDTLSVDASGQSDEAQAWRKKASDFLAGRLTEAFAEFPRFELYPGVDVAALKLLTPEGRLNFDGARAMAVLDSKRLRQELNRHASTGDAALQADLVRFAIEMNREEMAGWITGILKDSEKRLRSEAMQLLKAKPWFGAYGPIMSLVDSGDRQVLNQALYSLRDQMSEYPELEKALATKADDPASQSRGEYAVFLLSEIEEEDLARYGYWLQDPDLRFSKRVFQAMRRRSQDILMRISIQRYERVHEDLQTEMVNVFKYDPEKTGAEGLAFLERAAASTNMPTAHAALRALQNAARYPEAWPVYRELGAAMTNKQDVYRYRWTLLQNVGQARPGKAASYLREELGDLQLLVKGDRLFLKEGEIPPARSRNMTAQLRDQAVSQLLYMAPPWHESVAALKRQADAYPEDVTLHKAIFQGFWGKHGHGDWDHTQPEYIEMLRAGTRHPEKRVRLQVYQMLRAGVRKGMTTNTGILQDALETENDPDTKARLASILTENS